MRSLSLPRRSEAMSDEEAMANPLAADSEAAAAAAADMAEEQKTGEGGPIALGEDGASEAGGGKLSKGGLRRRARRGGKERRKTDGQESGESSDGRGEEEHDKASNMMAYFYISVGTQLIVYLTMWMQWDRQRTAELAELFDEKLIEEQATEADMLYWVLILGTLAWVTQVSQVTKHLDPNRATIFEMVDEKRSQLMDILGANPVPEPQAIVGSYDKTVLDNLTWHARMVFSPLLNMLISGFILNYLNITSLEQFASSSEGTECTDNILGVISNIPPGDLNVMAVGFVAFTIGAMAQLKLAEAHFAALNKGYVLYFRNTQSVKLLQQAIEKATRGAAVFTNSRMRNCFFVNLLSQIVLLYLLSIFSGVDEGGEDIDVVGAVIFSVLVFERFLVGFQIALVASYVNKSTEIEGDAAEEDTHLRDIEYRERVQWHGEMVFYTGMFAVLQSLICLSGLLTVIPFFKEVTAKIAADGDGSGNVGLLVGDCEGLEMGLLAKMDRATSQELQNFWICMLLWLLTFLCQVWLTRTHYVQYWRYQKDVIFTMEMTQRTEGESEEQTSAKAVQWERQRAMMVRIGRLRATAEGDAVVIRSLMDHFGLAAVREADGLTELDVRMALTQQLETVYQDWKVAWQQEKSIGKSAIQNMARDGNDDGGSSRADAM